MHINELILNEKVRGDCYRLLSACFYQPDKSLFMQENLLRNLVEALKRVCPPASVFAEKMEGSIVRYTDEDLLIDYAKLFVGPNELIAPPYGSVYLDRERRVMGDSTLKTMELYREAGLVISDDFKELPDHVAIELEFMYYLVFKEVEALEKSDMDTAHKFIKMQQEFLNSFLGLWINPFCEKIKEGTDNKFYHSLAECVSVFIMNSTIPYEIMNEKAQGVLN
ncbi:dehydrogenase [Dissulfurispira thermophila]|uniref:Dehydrogenase n=2 Tax=root TaxID=1 RepID=A0A7G1H262_9BACT|nr:molecular chaperone TorD family protein [Dissulfurispira thermophila]BCB96201.1 dehydrogenase [Dissulfurispira thermophila]